MQSELQTPATSNVLIDQAIGHLGELDHRLTRHNGAAVDWVDLTWTQCARRAFRIKSRGGRDLKILLRLGQTLRHGDIVWQSASRGELVAVNVLPTNVIVGRTGDAKQLALLAYELGNLHVPIELEGDLIISPFDGPVMEAFEKIGIDFQTISRRFIPTAIGTPGVSLSAEFRIERK
jgi:urease accessory protein